MNAQLRRIALFALALLVVGVLTTAGAASAGSGHNGACQAPQSAPSVLAAASTGTALRTYDDFIEDVQTAPDICGSNLVTNDNIDLLIAMHIHDRDDFAPADAYSIYLDTDANPATGTIAAPGVPAGAEALIQIFDEESKLLRWNGSAFEQVPTQEPVFTIWIPTMGPIAILDRADLGDVQNINLVFVTSNGVDYDYAPDTGAWPYTVAPLQLTPGPLSLSPARAGKPLTAGMEVTESAFGDPLDDGTITCRAKVGGRSLAGRGKFANDRVACSWRVPKTARGKRLGGSVAVEFEGVVAKRSFNVRVK